MDRPEAALFRALSFIESHLDGELSLDRVAGEVFYSPYHFHRLFRQFTGESFAAYVRRLRLENSSVLLRSGRPVAETALASGYWTHEAFTRAFHRVFGRPPRKFSAEPLSESASDRWLDRPYRVRTSPIVGWKRRLVGPYDQVLLPGMAGSPWPPDADRCLGICWDDPAVTRFDRIRYDVFWTNTSSEVYSAADTEQQGAIAGRIEGGRAIAALHRGAFRDLTESYHYLLFMAPRNWGLRLHPISPPYEEFLPEGILITVQLEQQFFVECPCRTA